MDKHWQQLMTCVYDVDCRRIRTAADQSLSNWMPMGSANRPGSRTALAPATASAALHWRSTGGKHGR
jgi:hypothetical protein